MSQRFKDSAKDSAIQRFSDSAKDSAIQRFSESTSIYCLADSLTR